MFKDKRSVLIVDDEKFIRESLCEALQILGFNSYRASSVPEAMEIFHTQEVDLIISDINMTSLSGFDLMKKIKLANDTPVILMTAYPEKETHLKVFEGGADNYLIKPFTLNNLKRVLTKSLL